MSLSGVFILVLYAAAVCGPAAVAAWLAPAAGGFVYEAGRGAALTGFTILILQAVLAARWKWASGPFGLDIVLRFHRRMAIFAGVLLLSHPILLAAGGAGIGLVVSRDVPWYIWGGRMALVLLLVNIFMSAFRKRVGLDFELWRSFHDMLGPLIVGAAFVHSWRTGGDLRNPVFAGLWILLTAGGLTVLVVHRFVGPVVRRRRPWRVAGVRRETEDVCTVELEPPDGRETGDYLAGRFHFITLHRGRGLPEEEHHFTISSPPTRRGLVASTIKAVGDFTATIPDTKVGDTASVQGAFGRFSYELHPGERDLVFVAGGIGITPLMSMLRAMRDRRDDCRVLLLYANRTESGIVFRDELAEIESGEFPRLRVVHVLSRSGDEWRGEKGHIDGEMLRRHVGGDLREKVFYVCGPGPLLEATVSNLREMGVKDRQIRIEIFRLID